MNATKRRPRIHLRRNEHGGPMLELNGPHVGEGAQISAVPMDNGSMAGGYVWIGTDAECFGHLEVRALLAFADAIRKEMGRE